jgi:hypothetical protein
MRATLYYLIIWGYLKATKSALVVSLDLLTANFFANPRGFMFSDESRFK